MRYFGTFRVFLTKNKPKAKVLPLNTANTTIAQGVLASTADFAGRTYKKLVHTFVNVGIPMLLLEPLAKRFALSIDIVLFLLRVR